MTIPPSRHNPLRLWLRVVGYFLSRYWNTIAGYVNTSKLHHLQAHARKSEEWQAAGKQRENSDPTTNPYIKFINVVSHGCRGRFIPGCEVKAANVNIMTTPPSLTTYLPRYLPSLPARERKQQAAS